MQCFDSKSCFPDQVKLFDHLKRQQGGAEAADGFTCTHCNKKFALERLLRDHMRRYKVWLLLRDHMCRYDVWLLLRNYMHRYSVWLLLRDHMRRYNEVLGVTV